MLCGTLRPNGALRGPQGPSSFRVRQFDPTNRVEKTCTVIYLVPEIVRPEVVGAEPGPVAILPRFWE